MHAASPAYCWTSGVSSLHRDLSAASQNGLMSLLGLVLSKAVHNTRLHA